MASLERPGGAYLMRPLLQDVPLSDGNEDENDAVRITIVELWNQNLYVGTSRGEILHFVELPSDSQDALDSPMYMLASRLQPAHNASSDEGVQQILLLPTASKACILCNNALTFYSLPELSPVFATTKPLNCCWVGGLHLDEDVPEIMICLKNRIRLVKIGEEPRRIRDIEFPGCLAISRRGNFACVADSSAYALLDVVHQQKIHLPAISSLDTNDTAAVVGGQEDLPTRSQQPTRSISSSGNRPLTGPVHERSSSLGGFPGQAGKPATDAASISPARPQSSNSNFAPVKPEESRSHLSPKILSPSEDEFLLATGTTPADPGVGIVVNLDGDVVRGSVEFASYPDSIVVDHGESESYIIAIIHRSVMDADRKAIEVQRWDTDDSNTAQSSKEWLQLSALDAGATILTSQTLGLRRSVSAADVYLPEIREKLIQQRLTLATGQIEVEDRDVEELKFIERLCKRPSDILVWGADRILTLVRNPTFLRLEAQLINSESNLNRKVIEQILDAANRMESRTELDFLGQEYIKQRAALLLYTEMIARAEKGFSIPEQDLTTTGGYLMDSAIDPRVLISFIPDLREEIRQERGIRVQAGLASTLRRCGSTNTDSALHLMKRYLMAWSQKKGLASIVDEADVFSSVDAALIKTLLKLDKAQGPAVPGSIRAELNAVIDTGVSCFDRAVAIFEQERRLYLLSRLYQSRKMSSKVLNTWKRIIEGESDTGGELVDGEQEVRKYVTRIKDEALFQQYAVWLAGRNPRLGVEVFADDRSRIRYSPDQVLSLLKRLAPAAVKYYLEHLVFVKKASTYANDLILFYLDVVMKELEHSQASKDMLIQTYETYRALAPPKPTYRQFFEDNAVDTEWWHSRVRLLHLLNSTRDAAASYDVPAIASRLKHYERELIPEIIILNGRQGNHERAIHLLTHGLGDFDTAVSYCLLGGSSIFPSDTVPNIPSHEQRVALFRVLLKEFMLIVEAEDRMSRTSELLGRFGPWFDCEEVISMLPESWSLDVLADFLMGALRRALQEQNETSISRALNGAVNLQTNLELVNQQAIGICEDSAKSAA